nr:hypothetical protein Itr_chr11CG12790 [Ipomoea trifida]
MDLCPQSSSKEFLPSKIQPYLQLVVAANSVGKDRDPRRRGEESSSTSSPAARKVAGKENHRRHPQIIDCYQSRREGESSSASSLAAIKVTVNGSLDIFFGCSQSHRHPRCRLLWLPTKLQP